MAEPEKMTTFIKAAMLHQYGLKPLTITAAAVGWSASAYTVIGDSGDYYVKVYDKQRPSVQPWIDRINSYTPVLRWLHEHTPLHDRISAPILSQNQDYKAENENFVLLVFPLIQGETVGERRLNREQIQQIAAILAELHNCSHQIPATIPVAREDYSLAFLQRWRDLETGRDVPQALADALQPQLKIIRQGIKILPELAAALHRTRPPEVLCHTDLHGWNLMLSDNKVILIDWEGLCLAPAEADLFSFSDGFFFAYAQKEFLSVYRLIRNGYTENQTALRFYRLRRRLEDITEFAFSVAYDHLSSADITRSLQHIDKECSALAEMV